MNTKLIADTTSVMAATNGSQAARKPTEQRRIVRKLPVQKAWSTPLIIAAQVGIFAGLIALWEIAADFKIIDPFFWSQPSVIWSTLITFLTQGDALTDIVYTFQSTILGFILGTVAGSLLGMSFWWSGNYARIMQPYVVCLESIPKLALAPLIVLVFGMGLGSKVAIAVALTVVVSTLTAYAGVRSVDKDQERLFYSIGASRWQVFTKLVIPSCIPWIISILRVNIAWDAPSSTPDRHTRFLWSGSRCSFSRRSRWSCTRSLAGWRKCFARGSTAEVTESLRNAN